MLFLFLPKRLVDLYKRVREALIGGLFVVFTRMAVSWVTKICPHQVEHLGVCQQILDVDLNSLYFSSISEKCPTGFFLCLFRRK